jgi:hypothetical protein
MHEAHPTTFPSKAKQRFIKKKRAKNFWPLRAGAFSPARRQWPQPVAIFGFRRVIAAGWVTNTL